MARATHSVTVETANLRGGELRDCKSGIWLALFDQEGRCAVNHVVGLVREEESKEEEGGGGGKPPSPAVVEFDRGTEETFAICASGLGEKIEKVWIGPGASTWLPEKVTVVSRSTNGNEAVTSTFRNNAMLGERQDVAAAELRPFDPEEFQRSASRDNTNYAALRNSLLLSDALLVSVGSALLYASQGKAEATNFGAGGAIGFLYLSLLSSSVASIGRETDSLLEKVLGFPATRFLLVLSLTYLVVQNSNGDQASAGLAQDAANSQVLRTIVETVAGLLMYKVSVLLVSALKNQDQDQDSSSKEERE